MITAGPGTAVTAWFADTPSLRIRPRITPATPSGSTIMLFWTAEGGSGAIPEARMVSAVELPSTSRSLSELEPMSMLTYRPSRRNSPPRLALKTFDSENAKMFYSPLIPAPTQFRAQGRTTLGRPRPLDRVISTPAKHAANEWRPARGHFDCALPLVAART